MGNMLPLPGKVVLLQKNIFPPVRTIFPLLGKIVLTYKKNVFPLKGNMCP